MALPNLEKITTNPAADTTITYVADEDMIVHSLAFSLVTSATAATRRVLVLADDGADTFFRTAAKATQIASLVYQYSAFDGSQGGAVVGDIEVTLDWPENGLSLRKNDRLLIEVIYLQAGDDLSAATLRVERP